MKDDRSARQKRKDEKQFIRYVMSQTGLSKRTILELFDKQWTLKREIDKPDIWERSSFYATANTGKRNSRRRLVSRLWHRS
jgi:hypothetical protein